jgi:SAM-dependent methyltransferase
MPTLMAHLGPDLVEFVLEWLPRPTATVIEVGCGSGALTRLLSEHGYDVLGVDPDAPDEPGFVHATLEEFERPSEFDAAVAVRSLHHLHDVDRALDNLRDAVKPGGHLVVFEFAIEQVDAAAERWLDAHGLRHPASEAEAPDVIPLGEVRSALEWRFRTLFAEPATYLAREADRGDLVAEEERAIEAGDIKPAGMRLVLERV